MQLLRETDATNNGNRLPGASASGRTSTSDPRLLYSDPVAWRLPCSMARRKTVRGLPWLVTGRSVRHGAGGASLPQIHPLRVVASSSTSLYRSHRPAFDFAAGFGCAPAGPGPVNSRLERTPRHPSRQRMTERQPSVTRHAQANRREDVRNVERRCLPHAKRRCRPWANLVRAREYVPIRGTTRTTRRRSVASFPRPVSAGRSGAKAK